MMTIMICMLENNMSTQDGYKIDMKKYAEQVAKYKKIMGDK